MANLNEILNLELNYKNENILLKYLEIKDKEDNRVTYRHTQSDIKDLYDRKTLTGKAEVGFSYEEKIYEPGQRETKQKREVKIISKKRLNQLLK